MAEHPTDKQLKDRGIPKHLRSKKKALHDMLVGLCGAYQTFHAEDEVDGHMIRAFIWEIAKRDPEISKFFALESKYLPEFRLHPDEGIASKKIVDLIIDIAREEGDDFEL